MMRTFNNGIGLVMVVNKDNSEEIVSRLKATGQDAYHLGVVDSRDDKEQSIQFVR